MRETEKEMNNLPVMSAIGAILGVPDAEKRLDRSEEDLRMKRRNCELRSDSPQQPGTAGDR